MIRIRTRIGEGRVFTLFFNGKWVTMLSYPGKKTNSTDADNLREAGENHLAYALDLQGMVNERGRLTGEVLHGKRYPRYQSQRLSDSHGQPHRDGTDGDGGTEGRDQTVSTDSSDEEDKDTFAF